MISKIYSIHDRCTGFGYPYAQPNNDAALRNFEIMLHDDRYELSKAPDDYRLYYLGTFDTETGSAELGEPVLVPRKIKEL